VKLDYHTQIYGVTQSGKTFLGLRLLQEQQGIRFFIDTKNETKYFKYFKYFAPIQEGHTALTMGVADGIVCLAVDVEKDIKKQLDDFLGEIFKIQRGRPFHRVTIMIDELQEYVTSRSMGKFVRACFLQGLSKNIRMIFTCQGWSLIPKNLRNNCENTIILKQREGDIKDMMDLGLVPYDLNEYGHKVSKLSFERKYQAYIEQGIGGEFGVLQ